MWSEIATLGADYGLIVLIFIASVWMLWNSLKPWLWKQFRKLFRIKPINKLEYNNFFTNINIFLNHDLITIDIVKNSPVRQQMFRDLITLELKEYHDNFKILVNNDLDSWDSDEWRVQVFNTMHKIKANLILNATVKTIPETAILGYLKWRSSSVDMIFQLTESLSTSTEAYKSNTVRMETLLLMLNLIMHTILTDAERTLKELNGSISGKYYNNKEIEESHNG